MPDWQTDPRQQHAEGGDRREDGDGGLRRSPRKDEFEERYRVADPALKRTERAVSLPDDKTGTFHAQCGSGDAQRSISPARDGAEPDVTEAGQLGESDRRVETAKRDGSR